MNFGIQELCALLAESSSWNHPLSSSYMKQTKDVVFLNIKQEDIVEDDVQEYKVTTSQNDKEKHTEGKLEEDEKEEDEAGDGSEEQEADYRSILMSSYQLGSSQQHQLIQMRYWIFRILLAANI